MRFSTLLWIAAVIGLLSVLLVVRFILGVTESFLNVQELPLPKGEAVTTLNSGMSDLQTEIGKVDVDALPDPAALLKGMRGLLDKYDRPEYVEHARRVMRMDPGELARMHLAAQE